MKILITGIAGFIASTLAEKLLSSIPDLEIFGIDNFDPFYDRKVKEKNISDLIKQPKFRFKEGDLLDANVLDSFPSDINVVIHLAAYAGVRPSIELPGSYIRNNIEVTNNILEWMNKNGIKKNIFASSSSVYGNKCVVPFREDDNTSFPISPYAFTKRACELMNYTYFDLYGIDTINLRLFTVYGPRQRPDLAIHKFTKLISEGKKITLYGDGNTSRDYTYVDDIVEGIIASIHYILNNNNVFEIINLGNSSPIKLSRLLELISKSLGIEIKLNHAPMQLGDVDQTCADILKAKNILGYDPKMSLKSGIEHFIEWYSIK